MLPRIVLIMMMVLPLVPTSAARAEEGWVRQVLQWDRVSNWREQRRQRAAIAARREALRRQAEQQQQHPQQVQQQPVQVAQQRNGTRVYAFVQREPDARRRTDCLAPRAVVGLEKYNIDEARDNAIAMWMEAEKLHNGVKYMNPDNAIVLSNGGSGPDCFLSSTGNRTSEKLAEKGGQVLHQCEFRARPCLGGLAPRQ